MFNDEVQEALDTFDETEPCELIDPLELVEEAKEKNSGLYKDLKFVYDLYTYHQSQGEIFAGSDYLSQT
jgi:hypothetical protein